MRNKTFVSLSFWFFKLLFLQYNNLDIEDKDKRLEAYRHLIRLLPATNRDTLQYILKFCTTVSGRADDSFDDDNIPVCIHVIMYARHHVHISPCIHITMYTYHHVYTSSCIHIIVYTRHHVYTSSCIHFVMYTLRHVYTSSCIHVIMYNVYIYYFIHCVFIAPSMHSEMYTYHYV